MKIKGLLMVGAALIVCGTTNSAQASERLSLYEVNNFVAKLANAVNSPDPMYVRAFLDRNISMDATYMNTMNATWVDTAAPQQVWSGYNVSPYYRYPQGYNAYMKPTSYSAVGKNGIINQIEHKKNMVPRYHQTMSILSTSMPSGSSSAVVDVNMREFGMVYKPAPYGVYHASKVEHSNARCQLQINKEKNMLKLKRMTCNTVMNSPML